VTKREIDRKQHTYTYIYTVYLSESRDKLLYINLLNDHHPSL